MSPPQGPEWLRGEARLSSRSQKLKEPSIDGPDNPKWPAAAAGGRSSSSSRDNRRWLSSAELWPRTVLQLVQ